MKSKAAVTAGDGTFSIREISLGDPIGNEVLVRIRAAGVCHTDFDSMSWSSPLVMGHEGAGEVVQIGPDVQDIRVGERVILNWAIPCGHCFQCERGEKAICENHSFVTATEASDGAAHRDGITLDGTPIQPSFNLGTMSQYALVREEAVVPITVDIPYASAAIIGCGVMTGYGSVVNAAQVEPGSSVVVLGTGGVGLNVVQAASIAGADPVIAVDLSTDRLEMARDFGATHTLQARHKDKGLLGAASRVHSMCHDRGADYAFECTANPQLGAAPLAMVRNGGTAVQVSGIEEEVTIDMELFEWDKTYINPLYGKCNPRRDFPKLLEHYQNGELKLDEMVSRTYSLEDLAIAFDDMHHGRIAKGVLLMEGEPT